MYSNPKKCTGFLEASSIKIQKRREKGRENPREHRKLMHLA
jgi:hypothetical protein